MQGAARVHVFKRSLAKLSAAAITKLLHLAPSVPGVAAVDNFQASYRSLLCHTGSDGGQAAQAN